MPVIHSHSPTSPIGVRRRGFTLIEALMAAGILLVVVVSVSSAITAGQQHSYEAHQRIAGTLAAEELMGRLITQPYASLPAWNGYTESVGAMTDAAGNPMPANFDMVGRTVHVTTTMQALPGLSVQVRGRDVRVQSVNAEARVLVQLERFIPEPQP